MQLTLLGIVVAGVPLYLQTESRLILAVLILIFIAGFFYQRLAHNISIAFEENGPESESRAHELAKKYGGGEGGIK
jgi:hypothetical protein